MSRGSFQPGHDPRRVGSGRKPKAEKFSGPIDKAERRIADRLPELVDSMFVLARGVLVEDTDAETGEDTVYRKPPERSAIEYLMNRVMGKPTERVEQDLSGAFQIEVLYTGDWEQGSTE